MEGESVQTSTLTSGVLPTTDDHASAEKESTEKAILTKEDLATRDSVAVAYSKDLLQEGDTLVYITYPGDSKCFDSTGFEISAGPHRVHSSRLLATGSKGFAKLFSSNYQYRILRRKKMVRNMPPGIKYLIDLTPPDEGDEAVVLTSELSCSVGVRLWYTTAVRCNIPNSMVGGEDEIMDGTNMSSFGFSTVDESKNIKVDVESPTSDPIVVTNFSKAPCDLLDTAQDLRAFAQTVRMSLEKIRKSKSKNIGTKDTLLVPDYCPIRHRAGIGRLLRVLEGKDPRLDSAPKVWTLFVLAKYFDCTTAIVDWIVSWMISHPNSQFIEILPEVSCKMAFGMRNQLICRAAFSILVSEEALSLASREAGHLEADVHGTNQFGRVRDDVDEDLRTRIEYASKNFASRICMIFEALVEEGMAWMMQLHEYQKLLRFKIAILNCKAEKEQIQKWISAVEGLEFDLKTYVRSQILSSLSASLTPDLSITANYHRAAENYMNEGTSDKKDGAFINVYNKLTDKERIYTRFFWLSLLYIQFPISFNGENPKIFDRINPSHPRPSVSALLDSQKSLNKSILEAFQKGFFNGSMVSIEVFPASKGVYDLLFPTNNFRREADIAVTTFEGKPTVVPWDPLTGSKTRSDVAEEPKENVNEWSNLMAAEKWNEEFIDAMVPSSWKTQTMRNKPEAEKPVRREGVTGMTSVSESVRHVSKNTKSDSMDVDEYLAQDHLLDPASGFGTTFSSDRGPETMKSDPVLRLKDGVSASEAPEILDSAPYTKKSMVSQATESYQPEAPGFHPQTSTQKSYNFQARYNNQKRWVGETYLSQHLRETQNQNAFKKRHPVSRPNIKPPPELIAPKDSDISVWSPLFNMSEFFLGAKDHIRSVANKILDRREMGFDVELTDTLLCLGPEEFKYLPLWAGGDDDDSGGVFEDAIPIAMAGPNGPGPSYHTDFSTASAASSEFDAMSDVTAINTSVAVEDGHSDHIDRRLVLADDDFHSETFSEDSETYDRKGKGVERRGFFSGTPRSEISFSPAATLSDSVPEITSPEYFDVDIDYLEEDSDVDTTVAYMDTEEEDDDSWDGGDAESFDFGDKDEEMLNI